jgi:starch phosphorylase
LARFQKTKRPLSELASQVVVQLNDTHPALGIVELMRVLLDESGVPWKTAWETTTNVFNYTNHTVLPEALEKWPVSLFETVIPRHMELIWEINHRFLQLVRATFPAEEALVAAMSIIEEPQVVAAVSGAPAAVGEKLVRMAHLAVIGSRTVNGVADMHTHILKATLFQDFHRLWPTKITNLTNGVTPRRWLFQANPLLTELIDQLLGRTPSGAVPKDLSHMHDLGLVASDPNALELWRSCRQENKKRLIHLIESVCGISLDPHMLFDVQVCCCSVVAVLLQCCCSVVAVINSFD